MDGSEEGSHQAAPGTLLERVIAAWRSVPDLNTFSPAATDLDLSRAEASLGRPLPNTLATLFRLADGCDLLEGNLQVDPISSPDGTPLGKTAWLRDAGWPIPPEVLMFGGNGSDDLFGLWYPREAEPAKDPPVVSVGSIFEPGCMALMATGLGRFLAAWSGLYFVILEAPDRAFDTLGVPRHLRSLDDPEYEPFARWADPGLPSFDGDPYVQRLDASGVRRALEEARIG